ncbi:semaphorin-4E isoform X1 [Triplophysa dalaica]|uniref:semaphorin-4E isoform X1 n=1 Tax=Triplophysa dalaica TaxID=1582913 RepID=UPI0024DF9D67|nr:semaphorin-4E isoform X1 [Triplophysa dalaica]XP_056598838.1 semaphorin-4E isoform X1 [Triplophysa dalaica]XP_056598839.1 semaphorin-4E isoform X1 [Triplophysa dalaica]XP_056598840.1 semaphorin-4E isoform X1 [Triplophysa dalaica]XP_056598841.1 semaphorin-4E isoform X1 [Triplophysa dalaica]XP_056598842.1 semaphorin-4E isoform X1 [Triplophysa dalaica]
MLLLAVVCLLCLWSPATLAGGVGSVPNCMPRKTVSLKSNGGHSFREDGVLNYTTMLVREDLNLLILGAREAIFALDLANITSKKAMMKWQVTDEQNDECVRKGKDATNQCKNYIRILHKKDDGTMYTCGTKAFNPTCGYLSWADGQLVLEDKQEDGKGKCPFDPFQGYTSAMVDGVLYSATSINFRGSELAMTRSSDEIIRTDVTANWLSEPNFIHMAHIPESENKPEGDDDKIYLFFTEAAVEYDSYSKVDVSRVARVCKGDLGGQRTLQKKWTSFLKARLECSVPNTKLPYLVQDAFHLCPGNWRTCVFYVVFTPQSDSSQSSAVCAYGIEDIKAVFSKGKFKVPVKVETSFVKWLVYTSDLPDPRPGACIDDYARSKGINRSLDLPDKTLQFIKDNHLMDQEVKPLGKRPLLVRTGPAFTRIVVATTTDLNGDSHHIMFIGTKSGSVLKAVNYDGEMVIMEEIQLFESSQPIKILRLSNSTQQLYAGSDAGVVQVSVSKCGRYDTCLDCVLARDPYCGWNLDTDRCSTVNTSHRDSSVIQSVKEGNASRCQQLDNSKPVNISFFLGNTVKLWCQPYSNLAQVEWHVNGRPIKASETFQILSDGLMVFNASMDDNGHYTCDSIETVLHQKYRTRHVAYDLKLWVGTGTTASLHDVREKHNTFIAMVVILTLMLAGLVIWNLYKGHLPLPFCPRGPMNRSEVDHLDGNRTGDHKLASSRNMNSNNNHLNDRRCSDFKETDRLATTTGSTVHVSLQYIDDESEI